MTSLSFRHFCHADISVKYCRDLSCPDGRRCGAQIAQQATPPAITVTGNMSLRPSNSALKPVNHRTRVGAERREKMRARLLESALLVFASQGVDATVVDEVISAAGVSRGSFYNYFRTNEELFSAVAAEVSNELLRIVDPVLQSLDDPAARVAGGIRLVMQLARIHPPLAAFVVRGGRRGGGRRARDRVSVA